MRYKIICKVNQTDTLLNIVFYAKTAITNGCLRAAKLLALTSRVKRSAWWEHIPIIDEFKKVEAALRVSDSNQRALLEALVDGVFVAQDYHFVFSNPVLPKMLGYTEAEFINIPFEKVISPLYLDVWNQRFTSRTGQGEEPETDYQVEFLVKGGQKTIWIDLHASRVEFLGKRSVLGIVRDISRQKAADDLI